METKHSSNPSDEEGPILGPLTIVILVGFFICLVVQTVATFLQPK